MLSNLIVMEFQFQNEQRFDDLQKEHINASLTIQKLKNNIQQLEQLRLQVKDEDKEKFSEKVEELQNQTKKEMAEFLSLHKETADPLDSAQTQSQTTAQDNGTSCLHYHHVHQHEKFLTMKKVI